MRTLVLATLIAISSCHLQSQATLQTSYKVHDSKPMKNVSIQIVSFDSIAGLNKITLRKINSSLITASDSFSNDAKACSTYAEGHPWSYKLTLEKVLVSEKYISVIFDKSTVCAGSPDLEKEPIVFSLPNGNLVPAKTLFTQTFPTAKLIFSMSSNKELIRLDEGMAETLIKDSNDLLKIYDSQCEFYLKHASYRIWADGGNMILFPEFLQPESFCQKEYVIQPKR
jgi:hypothetical protein